MSAAKLDKQVLSEGNRQDYPKQGDEVAMHYTGWLYSSEAAQNRGKQCVILQVPGRFDAHTVPDSILRRVEETSRPRLALAVLFKVRAISWATILDSNILRLG